MVEIRFCLKSAVFELSDGDNMKEVEEQTIKMSYRPV